jgi:hypothetical protein
MRTGRRVQVQVQPELETNAAFRFGVRVGGDVFEPNLNLNPIVPRSVIFDEIWRISDLFSVSIVL